MSTISVPAQPMHISGATTEQIDRFYDWIYRRGIARLAARGISPQMLYQRLHQEGYR
jgi:hypothetical protein